MNWSLLGSKIITSATQSPSAVVNVKKYSYRDLFYDSCLAARYLAASVAGDLNRGTLKAGDRAVIVGPNTYEHIVWIQACKRLGVIYTCLASDLVASSGMGTLIGIFFLMHVIVREFDT